jgi:hypothetical protein
MIHVLILIATLLLLAFYKCPGRQTTDAADAPSQNDSSERTSP